VRLSCSYIEFSVVRAGVLTHCVFFGSPLYGFRSRVRYLNVLCFGGIMTAFLVWRGMRLQTIGVWRGISSSIGLMGTFAYFYSIKHMSIISTGMWSIAFQFIALSVSYGSLFVDHYNTSLGMLIGGVCASRVGLWVFDISVTQLMQEYVEEDVRGVVGGVQQSLNALFTLLSCALGILIPDPRDFFIYVGLGYGSVGVAMLLYGFGVFRKQNELERIVT
jgi:iron-regulated transporter 1